MQYGSHYSVLKKESLDFLLEQNDSSELIYLDLTFGAGGHTTALSREGLNKVIATDQDPEALKNGDALIREQGLEKQIKLLSMNFSEFPEYFSSHRKELLGEHKGFDGILMDLGVSSHQFDKGERGFSFRFDAPLDMRMNTREGMTAAFVVNNYTKDELSRIFTLYGEEKFSYRIAGRICEKRIEKEIATTKDLEDIIFHAYPKKLRHGKLNPATKCFQALRIEVNKELHVLEVVIPELIPLLNIGGRLAVISFHSLEDRIVKQSFKDLEKTSLLPVHILTKKPIVPTEKEIIENSRSRSAKLRVIERVEKKKQKNKYADLSGRE